MNCLICGALTYGEVCNDCYDLPKRLKQTEEDLKFAHRCIVKLVGGGDGAEELKSKITKALKEDENE